MLVKYTVHIYLYTKQPRKCHNDSKNFHQNGFPTEVFPEVITSLTCATKRPTYNCSTTVTYCSPLHLTSCWSAITAGLSLRRLTVYKSDLLIDVMIQNTVGL